MYFTTRKLIFFHAFSVLVAVGIVLISIGKIKFSIQPKFESFPKVFFYFLDPINAEAEAIPEPIFSYLNSLFLQLTGQAPAKGKTVNISKFQFII